MALSTQVSFPIRCVNGTAAQGAPDRQSPSRSGLGNGFLHWRVDVFRLAELLEANEIEVREAS